MLARLAIIVLSAANLASAADYSESVSGDISDNRNVPTALVLETGHNLVSGTFGPSGVPDVPDLDYLTVTVPAGSRLAAIILASADVGGAVSFIGVQRGGTFTVRYTTSDPSSLLGWTHFGSGLVGADLLPEIGFGSGAVGFEGPLPSGQYTFWIMELDGARPYSYAFDFVVESACPCPADRNCDGAVDGDDVIAFFTPWDNGLPAGDFNSDGSVDGDDVIEFFSRWDAGC